MTNSKPTVTAANLRAYFQADPKRVEGLSAQAAHTVAPGAKGKVHPDAVKRHNQRRKVQYVPGATKAVREASQAQAVSLRAQAAEAGYTVGKRGPLPKEFLASLKG